MELVRCGNSNTRMACRFIRYWPTFPSLRPILLGERRRGRLFRSWGLHSHHDNHPPDYSPPNIPEMCTRVIKIRAKNRIFTTMYSSAYGFMRLDGQEGWLTTTCHSTTYHKYSRPVLLPFNARVRAIVRTTLLLQSCRERELCSDKKDLTKV